MKTWSTVARQKRSSYHLRVQQVLTSGKQVREVGLGEAEARVPVPVIARQQVLLTGDPPLVIQTVVLLQEPYGVTR